MAGPINSVCQHGYKRSEQIPSAVGRGHQRDVVGEKGTAFMGQVTSGVRAILSVPLVYEAFQRTVGSRRVRRELVDNWVIPRPGLRVLDVGCGPGDLIEYLPGVIYTGIDLSAAYIESARERFGDRGRWLQGRIGDLAAAELGEFDVVMAKSVLHHLEEDEILHLLDAASTVLTDGGRLITLDAAYTPDMSRAARFVVSRDRGQSILTPEGYEKLARSVFADVRTAVRHDLLRIPYTHIFMASSNPPAA